ncbi:MAG TPA: MFS transporter [Vicinamibacteria bacterium]
MNTARRLSVMMFLEYFIWGSWLPLLALYLSRFLGFTGTDIGWIFATSAIASVTAVFISGQIADRHLPTEKFLAVSHLVGGVAMISLVFQKSFWPFFVGMLVHNLMYVPTLSLTNSICFHHLKDAQKEFGIVRLWGTIGWIAASWPFVWILSGKTGPGLESALTSIFWMAGGASIVLALYSLSLPHTPPARGEKNAPLEAIKFLAVPAFLVLFIVTFMDSLVHACYFQWTSPFLSAIGLPENWIMPAMSIGQIAEIGTMAWLGFFIKKLGWRKIMVFGILGHAFRFAIYALGGPVWLVVGSNLVHGFCYAFFFASVYIFVDEYFPRDARASAQGLFNLLILGVGPFLGNLLWGGLGDALRSGATVNYRTLFLAPTALAVVAALTLAVAFKPPPRPVSEEEVKAIA